MRVLAVPLFLFSGQIKCGKDDGSMAFIRRMKLFTLFKYLVAPTMLLNAIFKFQALHWIAVASVVLWLIVLVLQGIDSLNQQMRRRRALLPKAADPPPSQHKEDAQKTAGNQSAPQATQSDLFLIRQVNYRITEQLKASYPMVSWLWLKRPEATDLCQGGRFRIRTTNTDPFNYGEVELSSQGRLTITMLQVIPLKDAAEMELDAKDDLAQEDILERMDVKAWYQTQGESILCQMIDDLNTQGHKRLLIKDNGDVVIEIAGKEESVELLKDFPPRMVWDDFCQLLKEDEITASIQTEGLLLTW